MAKIQIKRGLQEAVARLELVEGELVMVLDTGNVYVGTTPGKVNINPIGGTTNTAGRLKTPRALSVAGDATAEMINFDGSADVWLQLVLVALSGFEAGTYIKAAVNTKDQVTAGQMLEVFDIPSTPSSRVTGLGTVAVANTGAEEGNVSAVRADRKLLASLLPDLFDTYVPVTTTINDKPLSGNVTLTVGDAGAIPATEKGAANGVATLGSDGKVPAAQFPSYVDDVLEFENRAAFPEEGEDGKIYAAEDTNLTYRWSGTQYVKIPSSLALGETSSTAYPGDKGKAAYGHSQTKTGNPHGTTAVDVDATSAAHTGVAAFASQLDHVKPGTEFKVGGDGSLPLSTMDGGTFE